MISWPTPPGTARRGALVHRDVEADLPLLHIRDTLDGLWAIGRARRAGLTGDIVAVTGSSGKTTAKTLLGAALGAFATEGSLNNHLGVPLSLARTPLEAPPPPVFEIGANHPGEIAPLSQLVRPDCCRGAECPPRPCRVLRGRQRDTQGKNSVFIKGWKEKVIW